VLGAEFSSAMLILGFDKFEPMGIQIILTRSFLFNYAFTDKNFQELSETITKYVVLKVLHALQRRCKT
jgi:diphthamide synthase subunit DPH2